MGRGGGGGVSWEVGRLCLLEGMRGWRVIGGDEGVGFYVSLMGGDRWGKREERAGWR